MLVAFCIVFLFLVMYLFCRGVLASIRTAEPPPHPRLPPKLASTPAMRRLQSALYRNGNGQGGIRVDRRTGFDGPDEDEEDDDPDADDLRVASAIKSVPTHY
jgi:hypothetical protein